MCLNEHLRKNHIQLKKVLYLILMLLIVSCQTEIDKIKTVTVLRIASEM